jgi:hypothetical protein
MSLSSNLQLECCRPAGTDPLLPCTIFLVLTLGIPNCKHLRVNRYKGQEFDTELNLNLTHMKRTSPWYDFLVRMHQDVYCTYLHSKKTYSVHIRRKTTSKYIRGYVHKN